MTGLRALRTCALAGALAVLDTAGGDAQSRTTTIAGRVLQPDGAAAEGARVVAYSIAADGTRQAVATGTTSYDGRYEMTGLTAGTYIVGVMPSAGVSANPLGTSRPSMSETFYPDATDVSRAQRIAVAEAVPVEGIDVWLAPAPQRYSVSGRVYMPDGLRPDELVIEYGGPGVIRRGIWHVYDPGGLFEIEGVAQGPLVLLARARTARGIYMGLASTLVTVESVQDVRITMRPPGRIEGRLIFERELPLGTELRITPVQTLLRLSALYPVQEVPIEFGARFRIPEALGAYGFEVLGLPDGWTVKRVRLAGQPAPENRIVVTAEEIVTGVELLVGPGGP